VGISELKRLQQKSKKCEIEGPFLLAGLAVPAKDTTQENNLEKEKGRGRGSLIIKGFSVLY